MTSKQGLISLPFAGGFYRSRSRSLCDKRSINWYTSYLDAEGINPYCLLPTPGITTIPEVGIVGSRGTCVMNGKLYTVTGPELYRIDYIAGVWSKTQITGVSISGDSNRVIMAANKNQLVIVAPGIAGYIYTDGGAFAVITDTDFLTPEWVVAIDSYFVFGQTGTNVIFQSQLNDGTSYSALDAYIVSQLQKVVGGIVYRNQLYILGQNLIIPFADVGELQFAFRPIQNAAIDVGVETKYLSINLRQSFAFVGRSINSSLSVWLYSSGSPQRISTEPIDYILNKMADFDVQNAFMMQHSEAGSECITLTIGNYCFVYDLTASAKSGLPEWHERRTIDRGGLGNDYNDNPWSISSVVNCYGKNIAFSNNAVIGFPMGVIDDSVGTEFDSSVQRIFNSQPYTTMGVNTKVSALEIYTDTGVDDNSQLTLSWSDDGGFNYGNKLNRSTGSIGEYGRRLIWTQLGGFNRQRMIQVEYTGAYPRGINKLMANTQ